MKKKAICHSDKAEYKSFLWELKSYQIKKRDNFTCQICGKKRERLTVNFRCHLTIKIN